MDTSIHDPVTSKSEVPTTTTPSTSHEDLESLRKAQAAIQALSSILPSISPSLSSSRNPAFSLLHDSEVAFQISALLRQPNSGVGDNQLCRWLYDTFQASDPNLQLVVLRFLPIIAGIYLSRVALRKPLAGFEAVLLALYAHETASRNGQSITVSIPDISHSSIYHERNTNSKNSATELNLAVISPSLEPHGTVRSTQRARIVGVALELYLSKISSMSVGSKIDFCEFCVVWAGQDGDMYREGPDPNPINVETEAGEGRVSSDDERSESETRKKNIGNGGEEERERDEGRGGRIPLPWELLQPVLRILGHCLMMSPSNKEDDNNKARLLLDEAALDACRSLYARALHDMNPRAILAIGSLLRLTKMATDSKDDHHHSDPTDLPNCEVLTI